MAIMDVQKITMHGFRSSQRTVAIERKDAELRQMREALKELQSEPVVVEKEVHVVVEKEVIVEKVVEIPMEKTVEIQEIVKIPNASAKYTEADVEKAFWQGLRAGRGGKEEMAELMLKRMAEMKEYCEEKLRAAVSKEAKIKDMLRKKIEGEMPKEKIVEVPNEKVVENIVEFQVPVEVIVEKIVEVLVEKIVEVPVEKARDMLKHISEVAGAEVTKQAYEELKRQFAKAGAELLTKTSRRSLTAMTWKYASMDFAEALKNALNGGDRRDEGEEEYDNSSDKSEELECEEP